MLVVKERINALLLLFMKFGVFIELFGWGTVDEEILTWTTVELKRLTVNIIFYFIILFFIILLFFWFTILKVYFLLVSILDWVYC